MAADIFELQSEIKSKQKIKNAVQNEASREFNENVLRKKFKM